MSNYRMHIVDTRTGLVAKGWSPGDPKVELAFVEDLARRLKAKGVGIFKTEAKVLTAVESAWAELLHDLKARI